MNPFKGMRWQAWWKLFLCVIGMMLISYFEPRDQSPTTIPISIVKWLGFFWLYPRPQEFYEES